MLNAGKQRRNAHAQRKAAAARKEQLRYKDGLGFTRIAGYSA